MRAFLMGALGALVLTASVPTAADASSYGWPTAHTGAEWMNGQLGRSAASGDDEAPQAKGRRTARAKAAKSGKPGTGKAASRRVPAVSYEDVGAGGGRVLSGIASYYWQPQRVASGGWFNPNAMTAAHKTLPFGTRVRVTHVGNGRSVVVTINDRGPYIAGRIIDLSSAAAGIIGMKSSGIARVKVAVLGRG